MPPLLIFVKRPLEICAIVTVLGISPVSFGGMSMLSVVFSKTIEVEGLPPYDIVLCSDGQIVLQKTFSEVDEFGSEISNTMYAPTKNPLKGAIVYKKAGRLMLDYLHSHPVKYFWFSTGDEDTRIPLYDRLANNLAKSDKFIYIREVKECGEVYHHFYRI